MKAVYLVKYGSADKAFEIRDIETPRPKEGEVLIKTNAIGLNFADVVARRGLYPDAPKKPCVLGYDVAGIIESVGPGVEHFQKGDRVAGLTRFGGYSEYTIANAFGVSKLPQEVSFATGTALATQACTAYYCAVYCVNLLEGDKVLIHAAAGGVGSILCQIAMNKGCIVFGTASSGKQDYLRSLGVHHPIDYTKEDFYSIIKKELGDGGLDVVFDSIGGKTFKQSWKLIGPGGFMVNYGAASQIAGNNKFKGLSVVAGFGFYSPIQFLMSSKSMIAVNMLRIADHKPQVFQKVFEEVMELAAEGTINPLIQHTYKVSDIAEAHDLLESRKSIGKIVLEW